MNTAITSNIPEVQAMGMKGFEADLKPEKFNVEKMRDPETGKLVNVKVGDRGTIKPVDGYEPATKVDTVYGKAFDPYNTAPGTQVASPPDRSTRVNITNVSGAQQSAYGKELGKQLAAQDVERINSLDQNYQTRDFLDRIEALSKNAVLGGLSPMAVFVGQIGQSLGFNVPPEIANTEEGRRQVSEQVSSMLIGPGGAKISDADRRTIESSLDVFTKTGKGLELAIKNMRDANERSIARTQKLMEGRQETFPDATISPLLQQDLGNKALAPAAGPSKPIFKGWKQ